MAYSFLSSLLKDITYDAMAASVVIAILVAIRQYSPECVRAWYLLALGQAMYTMGDILWNNMYFRNGAVETPSWADPFYLIYYPLMAFGLIMLIRRRGKVGQPAVVMDVVLVSIASAIVTWTLVRPTVLDPELTAMSRAFNLAYPVGDVILVTIALRLAIGPGARSRTLHLMVLGLVFTTIADVAYFADTERGPFSNGGFVDLVWLTGYVGFGAAALHPTMRDLGHPISSPEMRLGPKRIALIATAVIAMPAGLLAAIWASNMIDAAAYVLGAAAISVLLLLRIVAAVRQLEGTLDRERILRAEAINREESRKRSERWFRSIVYSSSDVMILTKAGGRITWCGDSIERICGYLPSELMGHHVSEYLHPEDTDIADHFAEGLANPGASAWLDCRVRVADGSYRIFQVTGRNVLDDPAVGGLLFTGLDVTERRELSDQLIEHAYYDPLTGLANRALLIDRIERALSLPEQEGRQVAVLLIGLDNFKTVNDSLGHDAGDEVLRQTAERLTSGLRLADTAARLGGDEFAILLDGVGSPQAFSTADRIIGALSRPFTVDGHEVYVSASIGIATVEGDSDDPDGILRDATIAMHRAKSTGKNRRKAFRPSMRAEAVRRLELHGELQRAMEREEFVVFYQPIVDLETNKPSGFEALVRWRHPTHGIIGPDRFVPLAEETGLVVPLGRQILRQACFQATEWHSRFSPDLRMTVNMSAKQVADGGLLDDVGAALRMSGIDPCRLTLELTESALMADIDLAAKRLKALRMLGIKIAIDDFGTGYSSLAYLDRLPIDLIKIDRSFVSALDDPTREPTLVRIMIDLASHLGIPVVAEGIESPTQRDRLRQMGCPLGQGYLFSPPQDAQTLEGILTDLLAVAR